MIVRSIVLLVASITLVFAQQSHSGNFFDKRGTGELFQGMRGTRSFALSSSEDLLKRAPMGFQGTRGKKSSIIGDVENEVFPDSMDKRAPMGFQGTRGKKALSEDEYYKRAPMGFQGMRGKKSLGQIFDDIEGRTAARFHDSAGKRMYSIDYPDYGRTSSSIDRYRNFLDKSEFLREWKKRAPMGFQGMRGKKTTFDTLDEFDKRGIISFHEAQDTNDTLDNYLDYSNSPVSYEKRSMDFQDTGGDSFKRARMGFHGMRGKREATEIYEYNSSSAKTPMDDYQGTNNQGKSLPVYKVEKRSPYRYLGARGKKNPRWEFRGKFVGVRGKKSSIVNGIGRKQAVF
ncbi:tachykinin isoform X2 [Xylocopa sonorina]|uniref:tachykinin isoform X2 n=1 Tax=Xylocopa sonorina TaxID=1818115 RepID=UPI00403AF16F